MLFSSKPFFSHLEELLGSVWASMMTKTTWRTLCSSFLAMTCCLFRDYNILPKKELHRSLQVAMSDSHVQNLAAIVSIFQTCLKMVLEKT